MKMPKIAVLGSLVYDCVTWGERLPRMGESVIGTKNGFFTGGKGANQAVQAAKLGADVYMIGRVGNDSIGDILINAMKGYGVKTDYITKDSEATTGTCCIHVTNDGDNAIMIVPQANLKIQKADIDKALPTIQDCDIFITQLETNLDAIEYALEIVSRIGIPIVLNPAPAQKIPDSFFKYAHYFTPNESETEFYTGTYPGDIESCNRAAAFLHKKGVKNVVLTLGSKGCYFSDGTLSSMIPAYEIKAVDATAAGDAFNAAFAFKIAQKLNADAALVYGNAAGAVTAMQSGAQSSLGDAKAIEEFMQAQVDLK